MQEPLRSRKAAHRNVYFCSISFTNRLKRLLMKSGFFFSKNFFFQGCENPKETTKGESVHFLEPPLAALCMAVSHRCTHQRAASGNAGWQHPALAAAGDRQDRNSECWRWQHWRTLVGLGAFPSVSHVHCWERDSPALEGSNAWILLS